jgi:hypothetical protein
MIEHRETEEIMIPREVQQCDAQDVEQSWSRRGAALIWTAARLTILGTYGPASNPVAREPKKQLSSKRPNGKTPGV